MSTLDGKIAIVTGAARGLGRAYAHRISSLGAKVAVTDRDLKSYAEFDAEASAMTGDTTVDEITAAGGEALGFEFDISDRDAIFGMVDEVVAAWGRVDILVANAGGGRGTIDETLASQLDPGLLELVTRTNYYGTVHSCSAVAPVMKAQRYGKIVTTASMAGLKPLDNGGYAHYGAAKAAIVQYTRYLAKELAPYNITCNAIAPGVIGTARVLKLVGAEQTSAETDAELGLHRNGRPADCANVVEFLVTELSDYVSGVVIPVDGGRG